MAEYWRVKHTSETVSLYQFPDGTERTFAEGQAPADATPVMDPQGAPISRTKDVRSVEVAKMNAIEFLKEEGQEGDFQPWPGRYIPFIPVIGKESYIDGDRRWIGVVRPSMDAQRSYNVMRSAQVEGIGLAPKAPWVAYAETIEGYEPFWNQANTRNFPWLPVKAARDGQGNVLPPPQRNVVEPAIQAITLAAHEANDDIYATSGQPPVSLGQMDPHERSGKAVVALQKQAELGSSGYIDNLANLSMVLEGKIMRDLIPKVYFRPGRIVAAVGADDQRRSIMVGKPFIIKDGRPIAVPEGTPDAKLIDLSQGEYSVAVTIGKSFTTRREEGVSAMGEVIAAVPQIFPIVGDLYVGNMDFPGARQMADRLKKTLPPNLQDEQDGNNTAALQQQLQQAQQMMQMLSQELQAKTKIIETDAVKNEANLRIKQIQEGAENERSATEAKLKQAELESKFALEMRKLEVQLEIEMAKLGSAQSMKRAEIEQEQLHQHGERLMREQELGAEQAQADMDRQNERDVKTAEIGLKAREGDENRELQREEGRESRNFEAEENERTRQTERELAESKPQAGA